MRTVLFIPPLSWLSGGLATLYRLALTLQVLGYSVSVTSLRQDIPGLQQVLDHDIPFLPWNNLKLSPSDLWVVPESHSNALAPGLQQQAKTVVYVQNWYYLLSSLPEQVYWEQLDVSFLAVSHPVAWFMESCLRLKVRDVLPPVVAPCFFETGRKPSRHIRVTFMPRKNAAMGRQIRDVALAALGPTSRLPLEWVALNNMSQAEVAEQLAMSHIFMSTGFPEGFGLPPAEAMATGCLPVGCTGFGGWEYMRPASYEDTSIAGLAALPMAAAPCPLPYTLAPNGFYTADGDTLGAGLQLAHAINMAYRQEDACHALRTAGKEAASLFTEVRQKEHIQRIWSAFTAEQGA